MITTNCGRELVVIYHDNVTCLAPLSYLQALHNMFSTTETCHHCRLQNTSSWRELPFKEFQTFCA